MRAAGMKRGFEETKHVGSLESEHRVETKHRGQANVGRDGRRSWPTGRGPSEAEVSQVREARSRPRPCNWWLSFGGVQERQIARWVFRRARGLGEAVLEALGGE